MPIRYRETAGKIIKKLISPRDLRNYLRYRLVYGNEYFFFDTVDAYPWIGSLVNRIAPTRLSFSNPVFLAGLRRSGTTLFYRIMNSHPDLMLYNERFPGLKMNGYGQATANNIWSVDDPDRFRRIVRSYLGPVVRARYTRWGVKLALELAHPDHGSVSTDGMRMLVSRFPEARFVGITRDPRDFVLSASRRGGHDTQWWIDEYMVMCDLFLELVGNYPDRFMIIRYEDLCARPEEIARRCCEFTGLPFQQRMLDPSAWSSRGPRDYEKQGIVAQTAKWLKAEGADLDAVKQAAAACFPRASELGYSRTA